MPNYRFEINGVFNDEVTKGLSKLNRNLKTFATNAEGASQASTKLRISGLSLDQMMFKTQSSSKKAASGIENLGRTFKGATNDSNRFSYGLHQMATAINNMTKGSTINGVNALAVGLKGLGAIYVIKLVTDAIKSFTKYIYNNITAVESLTMKVKASTAGFNDYANELKFLRDLSEEMGVDFRSLSNDYASFAAAALRSGLSLSQVRQIYIDITKAGMSMKLSNEQLSYSMQAITQMSSKGVVSMEELRRQLGDHLPGALAIAAKSMNMAQDEFIKLVESGELASKDFLPKFAKQLKDELGGSFNDASASIQSNSARLGNALNELSEAMGSELYDNFNDVIRELAINVRIITPLFQTFAKVLNIGLVPFKGWLQLIDLANRKIKDPTKSIAELVYEMTYYKDTTKKVTEENDKVTETFSTLNKKTEDTSKAVKEAEDNFKDWLKAVKDVVDAVKSPSGKFVGDLGEKLNNASAGAFNLRKRLTEINEEIKNLEVEKGFGADLFNEGETTKKLDVLKAEREEANKLLNQYRESESVLIKVSQIELDLLNIEKEKFIISAENQDLLSIQKEKLRLDAAEMVLIAKKKEIIGELTETQRKQVEESIKKSTEKNIEKKELDFNIKINKVDIDIKDILNELNIETLKSYQEAFSKIDLMNYEQFDSIKKAQIYLNKEIINEEINEEIRKNNEKFNKAKEYANELIKLYQQQGDSEEDAIKKVAVYYKILKGKELEIEEDLNQKRKQLLTEETEKEQGIWQKYFGWIKRENAQTFIKAADNITAYFGYINDYINKYANGFGDIFNNLANAAQNYYQSHYDAQMKELEKYEEAQEKVMNDYDDKIESQGEKIEELRDLEAKAGRRAKKIIIAELKKEEKAQKELEKSKRAEEKATEAETKRRSSEAAARRKKEMVAYKVLAISGAVIDTYQAANAAYASLAGIKKIGPALGIAAAGAAIAGGLANVDKIRKQEFAKGGFPQGKNAIIQVNEKGQEAVLNANAVRNLGRNAIDNLNAGKNLATNSNIRIAGTTINVYGNPTQETVNNIRDNIAAENDRLAKQIERMIKTGQINLDVALGRKRL